LSSCYLRTAMAMVPAAYCLLCPYARLNSIAHLTMHLKNNHRMYNSANLLARIIVFTPFGKEEVFQVLKDVHGYELCLNQKNQKITALEDNFKKYKKDINKKISDKDKKITDLNKNVELLKQRLRKYKETHKELISEKDKKVSDLKNKISNLSKEKNFMEENFKKYESCSSKTIMEKDNEIANLHDQFRNLFNDVEAWNAQTLDKMISEKDFEKAKLNAKASGLDKDEEKLMGQFYIKRNENDLRHKDLKKYKNLSDEIKEIKMAENKKTLAEMELKIRRYQNIFSMLKNCDTNMADMYDDTDDKLLEAIKITSQYRKMAGNRIQELEKEVTRPRLYPDKNHFKKDAFKQDAIVQNIVKKAENPFNNSKDGPKSCSKEMDKPGAINGNERRYLNLKRRTIVKVSNYC